MKHPLGELKHEATVAPQPVAGRAPFLTPARVFLAFAWIWGSLFAIVTPPFQVPDEFQQFYRAYQVSQGRLTARRYGSEIGGFLPSSLKIFAEEVWGKAGFSPDAKADARRIWSSRTIALKPDDTAFYPFGNVSWHSPMNYVAQGGSIALARHLGCGAMGVFYAGRLGNLFVWSLLVYAAIRLIPILNWTIVLLALTPMSLAQAASLSADATVNGVCFLFTAAVVRLASSESRIPPAHLVALMILGAAVSLAKTAYLPLTILFLLIPPGRFSTKRRYWMAFAIFLLVCLATMLGWSLCTFGAKTYSMPGVNPRDQAIYMLRHPLQMAHMEIGMLVAVPFIASIIGQLGWHAIRLWLPCAIAYWAVLFWSTRLRPRDLAVNVRQRMVLSLAVIGCWIAVFSLIYLTFTVVGGRSINGLQGRYMIPAMLPFMLLFYSPVSGSRGGSGDRSWIIPVFSAGFSLYTLAVLVHAFYI
jgi:uncharacterized membrane protein